MSWQDREAGEDPMRRFGRPGGDWQGLRPSLDNPMSWALTLGRVWGITVRVHVFFLVFVAVELLQPAFGTTGMPFVYSAMMVGILFVLVLLHEFGHCVACRATGGEADEILMWPLGGLAFCRPEHRWTAHLATALGGPLVNVAILAVLAPLLGMLTGQWWGVALPSLLTFPAELAHSLVLTGLFLANAMNLILLLFNLMLPVFPLDGGRVVQAVLWRWMGYARSMRVAVYSGYVGSIALAIVGMTLKEPMLLGIAVFGGLTCYVTQRQLQFTEQALGFEPEGFEPPGPRHLARRQRQAQRRAAREQQEVAAIDAILRKIAKRGMGSLSASEKRRLRRATQQRRKSSE